MNIYQIREAIRNEMAQATPNEALITELILERDRLNAAATIETSQTSFHARMLDAMYN